MNVQGGTTLIKKSIYSFTANRGFFWTLALSWMMMPIIYMFVWITAAGGETIGGFTRNDFLVYYIILIIINQVTYPVSHWTVGDNIFSGQFSCWLLRPLPPIYEAIASDVAVKIICLPFVVAFSLILGTACHIRLTLAVAQIPAFLLCLLLSLALRFMLSYALSLTALMKAKTDSLLSISDTLFMLLSGQIIPTMLFPEAIRTAGNILPFRYMLGFPVEVLLGRLSTGEIVGGIGMQFFWLAVMLALHEIIYRIGIRHYSSTGG